MVILWPIIIALMAMYFTWLGEQKNHVYMGVAFAFTLLLLLWIGHPLAYLGGGLLLIVQLERLYFAGHKEAD